MRLLLVEDDPLLLHSLSEGLREENYAVDTATDGQTGLTLAQDIDFDAIVLDGMLPVLDGWQFLAALRTTKHTPVLMLTARDTVTDRIRGLDTGADDYLTKPFDFEELLARLRALVRRHRGMGSNTIVIGDITLNLATRTLHNGKQPIPVTPREYALVEHLALQRGTVVSRTELYEHLFDENEDSLSNLLDVHVSNIRKKISADFITTRRGHGYIIP